jgi:hypothetical protein
MCLSVPGGSRCIEGWRSCVRGYDALPESSGASDELHRIRVAGPDGDQRSIRVAERRMGQVGGEPVTLALTRRWETERRHPGAVDMRSQAPTAMTLSGQPEPGVVVAGALRS